MSPPVIAGAALSAVVAGSAITAGALTIGFSLSAFAGSLILGGLSYALTPKPKKPAFTPASIGSSTVAVRQSDLTRQIVYGHTRVTRGYAHMWSTGVNGELHMILILCEGPLRAINEVLVNDYSIPNDWIDSEGNVIQGRYAGYLTIRKHLGTEVQGADTLAMANLTEWTAQHRLAGIAYLYLIMKKNQDVYPTGIPNISAIVEGPSYYDPRDGENVWSTNLAIHSRDYIINDGYGFGAFSDDIDDTNISAQANICDEIVDVNAENYTVDEVDDSVDILKLTGDLLKLSFGDRVQISSTGTLPTGLSAATNYYVIPYQVMGSPRILLATSLENAMSKTAIDLSSQGSGVITLTRNGEPRYHGSGVIDTENGLSESLNNLVTCMAGRAINIGGKWTLLAGAWRTPALSFGIGDLRSGMAVNRGIPMSEAYNSVKGLFIGAQTFYQESEYPSARYQEFIDDDGGLESVKQLNLAFTDRPTTAQRIAKIELFRARQDIVFKSDFSAKALQTQPGDNVELDIERLGWEDKYFEVTQFALDISNGAIISRMGLRETAEAIFDWDETEAIDFDPAPNTALPDPFTVFAVTGTAYNSIFIDTRDGDAVYRLTLRWNLHPDMFVREYGDFEIQYKLSADPDWTPSFFVDGNLTGSDVVSSSINVSYDLRIRARNNLGVRSGWVTIENAIIGSSGGVGTTNDWGSVADSPSPSLDWGSVADAPTSFEDWEFVT